MKYNNMNSIESDSKLGVCFLFFAICFFWGGELFTFAITMDEELHAFGTIPNVGWLEQGRWGTYILNAILVPYTAIPVVPLGVYLLSSTAAFLLFIKPLPRETAEQKLLYLIAFLIFACHPVIYYITSFNTINYAIGVGFLCVAITGCLITTEKKINNVLAVLLLAFSIAIYQGFILIFIAMMIFNFLISFDIYHDKKIKYFFKYGSIIILSLFVYYAVNFLVVNVLGIEAKYLNLYISKSSVIEAFINPIQAIVNTFNFMVSFYAGDNKLYGGHGAWGKIFIAALLFLILYEVLKNFKRQKQTAILKLSLITAMLFSPFLFVLIANGNHMPTRSLISFPLVLALTYVFLMQNISVKVQRLWLLVGVLYLISLSGILNRTHQANEFARQFDKTSLASIMPVVYEEIREKNLTPPFKLLFNGTLSNRGYTGFEKLEVNGQSFFEFARGNPYRINAYMKMLGYTQFKAIDKNEKDKIVEQLDGMSKWPVSGSVKVVDQVIVVQL